MLNKEKIRSMVNLSIYEKHKGHEDLKIYENYKYDYVMTQGFSAFIRFTFCFVMCFVLYVLFNSNELFYNINLSGIRNTLLSFALIYCIGLFVYVLIAVLLYAGRYKNAGKNVETYAAKLRRLDRRFNNKKDSNNKK